jgi:hypothetical protein
VYEIVLAGTLGPLIVAFCTELGKRLGGTVADWSSRIKVHVRHRRGNSATVALDVVMGDEVTTLVLPEPFTDEARLALIELDIDSEAVCGHRYAWDAQAQAWVAADSAY